MVVRVSLSDGLMFPSGFTAPASYECVVFCRVPADWAEADTQEAVCERLYGKTWRQGNSDGSQYVVLNAATHTLTPTEERAAPWQGVTNTNEQHFWFYHAADDGELQQVEPSAF